MRLKDLITKSLENEPLSLFEARFLLDYEDKEALYRGANEISRHFFNDDFALCSIINARSGACSEDCKWCAQSSHYHTGVDVYDLASKEQVVALAKESEKNGVARFSFVASGRAVDAPTVAKICLQAKGVLAKTNLAVCASLGLLPKPLLLQLKASGITRYHCNLETAPSFFKTLCSTHTMKEKVATIRDAKEAGLSICSGAIIGMGESKEQRLELCLVLRDLEIDSIPLNILNPIAGTPLEQTPMLEDQEILDTIALFRFTNPKARLRFSGGRALISHIQKKAILAGINGAIVGNLLTTDGLSMRDDVSQLLSWRGRTQRA